MSLVLFLCLAGRPLLSLCMPFALALLATWLTEPLLRFFHRRWNIPRGIGAIVLILLLVGALGGLMAALIWKGWSELPPCGETGTKAGTPFRRLTISSAMPWTSGWPICPSRCRTPFGICRTGCWPGWRNLFIICYRRPPQRCGASPPLCWPFSFSWWPGILPPRIIPISAGWPGRPFPGVSGASAYRPGRFSAAFGGYLKAEDSGLPGGDGDSFGGLFPASAALLGVAGGGLGILDFIPIVGAGTVMVPWSVILLVLGEWKRGVAFLAVWGLSASSAG